MVCLCWHRKDQHETERDAGYHGGHCSVENCICTSYINQKRRLENDPKPFEKVTGDT